VNYVSSLYNFGVYHLGITVFNSSYVILCLFVAVGTCINFVAAVWFFYIMGGSHRILERICGCGMHDEVCACICEHSDSTALLVTER
jgi:hypothetical protein